MLRAKENLTGIKCHFLYIEGGPKIDSHGCWDRGCNHSPSPVDPHYWGRAGGPRILGFLVKELVNMHCTVHCTMYLYILEKKLNHNQVLQDVLQYICLGFVSHQIQYHKCSLIKIDMLHLIVIHCHNRCNIQRPGKKSLYINAI